MKEQKPWVEEFSISNDEYQSWFKQMGQGESISFWALKNNKLDSKKYLTWARNHYELASINTDFFKQKPNMQLWQQIQSVANWSASMVPLQEWDGVVFVGCVEPVNDITWSFPVQYVLADAHSLQTYWDLLQSPEGVIIPEEESPKNTAVSAENTVIEIPDSPAMENYAEDEVIEPQTLNVPNVVETAAVEPPAVEQPILETPEQVLSEEPSSSQPALEGLDLSALNTDSISESPVAEEVLSEEPSANEPVLEGLDLSALNIEPSPEPTVVAEQPMVDQPEPALSEEASASEPVLEGLDLSTLNSNAKVDPPPADQKAQVTLSVTPDNDAPETVSDEAAQENAVDAEVMASLRHTANCDDSTAEDIFKDLHKYFKACMLVLVQGEDQIKPWIQDGKWEAANEDANLAYNISDPCVFKIVKKSGHPYHGPVSSNDVNDQFFKNWGYTGSPDHITITPLSYDGHIAGMLICVGARDANTLHALSFAEQCTEKLKPILEKMQSPAAA